ncbi:endosome-associated-trafficking regulator 1-like isoform X2 [Xenia sp. Carnegie-2017]|uniref:endosome-associated-trafficking regulator 1-like isoform X2 n=1 Tax=Xenia sp. Carnegie-2017 TaxID=2897299 RepID=UPI001F039076|nr:endosome-associated-trafficking regulator 1-like isoform X2 [Xenia sp. Carnegie-2017]
MSDDATEENPFSFKHFVKTISKETLENPRDNEIEERSEVPVSINGQANGIIQLNTDIPFPEVDKTVQKRQVKGKGSKKQSYAKEKPIESLQDVDTDNPFLFKNFVKNDAALKTGGRVLQIVDDEVCEVQNNTKINENKRKENIGANEDDLHNSDHTSTILKLEKSTVKLKKENDQLKRQLKDLEKAKELETIRADTLAKKLRDMQQKENEETLALEKMVQMVEKNLELTTQRASQAEAMSIKLKEENRLLRIIQLTKLPTTPWLKSTTLMFSK